MGLFGDVSDQAVSLYNGFYNSIPSQYASLVNLFIFSVLISLYAIMVWKFIRILAKKDLFSLNLYKYNYASYHFIRKFFASVLYLIEYIIVLPFLIFIWFAVLSLIILALTASQTAAQIILTSAAMVASIRILAYYNEDLSRDVSKIFPLTVLALFITNPEFFSLPRIFERLAEIPSLFHNILYFLLFITAVEVVMRVLKTIGDLYSSEPGVESKTENKTK